jgi:hypothetical protein
MGGALNWNDPSGIIAHEPQTLNKITAYIQNSTPETKQKLFDLFTQSVANKLTSETGRHDPATTIATLFDMAVKLNLPREAGIRKIVVMLDRIITLKPTSAVVRSVHFIMLNDEISSYVNRNRQFINKVAPHFTQLLAVTKPSSEFGKLYPKIAKIKLHQKYVAADKRRAFLDELNEQSDHELFANRPELAFGNIDTVKNSFGHSFMVPASLENIQKMISLRGGGYLTTDFQQMLSNFAMLINAGFKPQRLFINFNARNNIANLAQETRIRGFNLSGKTLIKGELNGMPVGITGTGMMYCLVDNDLKMTDSFAQMQQYQQQALFDNYKQKPKHGIYSLYERVAATLNK